ncbi:MAG TPA: type II toxin-antitoxin system death-on-curing family toxin [Devosia sp.]|nr:type II toxin-antitoxin system death-on-curing family toxin [Devosia sp.]
MRHYRVTFEDVIAAHSHAMTLGGLPGLLNQAAIESAIGRPYSGYHRQISRKAAALMHALVQNHGFVDGNKRTALLVTELLIRRSGYRLWLDESERVDDIVVDIACGQIDFETLVSWFKLRLVKERTHPPD